MKKIVVVAMLLAFVVGMEAVIAQGDAASAEDAKRADIRKLMDVTGSGEMGVQAMTQMIAIFKQQNPRVPEAFWDSVMEEVDASELIELCIPSYEKHFTHDEVKELIAFYETPLGKKLIETQPVIMQECMAEGQKWGQDLAEKVIEKLKNEGH